MASTTAATATPTTAATPTITPTPTPTLYEQSCLPPSLETGTGTAYPNTTSLSALLTLHNGPDNASIIENMPRDKTVLEDVTAFLEGTLSPTMCTPAARAALERLQPWFVDSEVRKGWGPDIIFKAFDDLDEALFHGRLRGRCQVQWKSEEELQTMFPEVRHIWGTTVPKRRRVKDPITCDYCQVFSAHIYLNSTKHFLGPLSTHVDEEGVECKRTRWENMWGTLLHEMCHAYLRLRTWEGYRDHMWSEGPDHGHGSHFKRCLKAVNTRSDYLLGIVGIHDEGEKAGCCKGGVDEGEWDEEWDEEEYPEEKYEKEEETDGGETSGGEESIFDENLIDSSSTDGDMSDAGAPQAEHEAKAKPQQESTKTKRVEAKVGMVKAAAKPMATRAPLTWANWGGKLMENVELRHVSGGRLMENVELRHVSKDISMEKNVEVEAKVKVEEKKAEVVTWANWQGKLLENKRR